MKRESAKQIAEERQRRAATRRKTLLKAKGWMLIKSILVMAIISTGHAKFWRVPSREQPLVRTLVASESTRTHLACQPAANKHHFAGARVRRQARPVSLVADKGAREG